ncbi:hypothetical protein SAMN05421505_110183 [Sinosporangium album]|uniref:Uncharacterized protein n=1 Tax=Sinosporangium album TaxID=504805 RepID=A0A1G7Z424_9ACTN|nr:hypothetical protein [Sinosporangium album]SDH03387.1 hypothetical protein SAMN05421505_110183 [Sinosporangium album]
MDPTALAAIVSALIGGVAGEAGRSAWTSLATLVRRRFGGESRAVAALESAESASDAEEITGILVEEAQADQRFAEELASWARQAGAVVHQRQEVTNTISGDARISGPVIQAGNVFGGIHLGGPDNR